MTKFTTGLLIATLCAPFSANAERPSFTSLQQQLNQLNAKVNGLESTPRQMAIVDVNGVLIGDGQDASPEGTGVKTIYFEDGQQIYFAYLLGSDFESTNTFYTLPDCGGDAYTYIYNNDETENFDWVFSMPSIDPNTLYRRSGDPATPIITVVSQKGRYGYCDNVFGPEDMQVSKPTPVINLTQYQYIKPYKYVLLP